MAIALSLTGSGHLLVYQLGACQQILNNSTSCEIGHVAGASGGALVAAVVALIPHRLPDYAEAFIEKRGGGLQLFQDLWQAERQNPTTKNQPKDAPTLHVAVTRCRDGKGHQFSFPRHSAYCSEFKQDDLLRCLEASCRIPPTFHPYDVLSSSPAVYPEQDGVVLMDGEAYVDGAIATPAPLTPPSSSCSKRLIVSPLTGTSKNSMRISPPTSSNSSNCWGRQVRVAHDLGIDILSWANLRALRAAMGLVTSAELREWYQRGQDDANKWLDSYQT